MTVRGTLGGIMGAVSVLGIGWWLGSAGTGGTATTVALDPAAISAPKATTAPSASASTSASAAPSASASASSASSSSAASTVKDGTYTGSAVRTRFGNVQVQVVVSDGRIADVVALQLTDEDSRSVSISNRAAPVLRSEVLSAQSASVNMVSGATYTSEGYLQSLQSALDQAGL